MTNTDGKVLGKILSMQSLLYVTVDIKWLGEILVKALLDVPGTESVALYIEQAQVTQASKPQCQPHWPSSLEFDESSSIITPYQNILSLPLETAKKNYGHLLFAFDDVGLFEPYSPHIENTLNIAALIIENKEQEEQLKLLTNNLEEQVSKQVRKLSIQKENLRQMFDEASYGIALADPDSGIMIDCNMAFATMLKGDRAKIIGKHQSEFHIADEHAEEISTPFNQHLGGKSSQTLESRMVTLTGENIDVEVKSQVIHLGDKQLLQGFFKDITENKNIERQLQLSKERFKDIAESMADWIWELNTEGQYTNVSGNVKEALGYDVDEIIGKSPFDFLPEDEAVRVKLILDQHVAKKESFSDLENINLHKNGSLVYLLSSGKPIISDAGTVLGFRGINRNVTRLRHAEEKRLQLESLLRQSQKMEAIGTMAGGIAHDFNNILAIISGNLEILGIKNLSGKPFDENLEHIKEASARAKALVAQILAFSRQEKPDLVPVNLTNLVGDSLKFLHPIMPTTIEVLTEVPDASFSINADTTQLQQVLINLCSNAVHTMDEKGLLHISLEVEELTEQEAFRIARLQVGRYAKLSVTDTGKGMDKKTLDRIFDPFFTTKAVGHGTGMGLSVVHGIMEQHGGGIHVDSIPGQGTMFSLYFPVTNDNELSKNTDTEVYLSIGSEQILLIDDEQYVAEVYGAMLQHLGYKVTVMINSVEALDHFKRNPDDFDLVITDQTMPKMSGVELATELLKVKPNIPIIICSGYSAQVNDEKALAIGIRAFCQKPLEMKQLASVVREVLDTSEQLSVTA